MSIVNEKIAKDIHAMLDLERDRDATSIFESEGYKRMLAYVGEDEKFKSGMERRVKLAFETIELTRSFKFYGLQRKTLMSTYTSINLLRNCLDGITTFRFRDADTSRVATISREIMELERRIGYLQDNNEELAELKADSPKSAPSEEAPNNEEPSSTH